MKHKQLFISSIIFLAILLIVSGCSNQSNKEEKIAYISANVNSEYEKVFEKIGLGILFDYNLKLPYANRSWVTVWVEGYKNGSDEPIHLTEMSFGLSPNKVEEDHMGFGIINPNSDNPSFFLYSHSGSLPPHNIDDIIFSQKGTISSWDYAIGNEIISLEKGETKILAVYQEGESSLKTYDYQEMDSIKRMINEDLTVLLLKIKVEERYD
ncbi:hypothetical protein DFP94_102283 [Fontibacillus phaseoli]|uniref:Lipoprotein n=1 Tax=Fontibacillus phaseoli TaxID=1416533 RepID=A0A369BIV6_9BACL|nr:hypothetical protein [Fontibacillus phaseoli]RCX21530.1 hypothetical protein DFP94_102283 [Fontibacillus phaseoli]